MKMIQKIQKETKPIPLEVGLKCAKPSKEINIGQLSS
jgi:hypothetical protein